ncbi:uncharacterized protein UV8b_00101 [Ustilaginoidea virens]|uniref:Uncharacterized protein n=1 Tax=Ustilaginoidea virens TaxID=1159556 RepID=A0A8E5HI50_USTVR|nr:uncharacterized protein UV8b_00101 [Ustilaginoidea virens]QUC15860.1 hypothetical protein UV8b_00101 [Ustilaginoidea virens]
MTSASPEGPHPPPVYGVWSSRASTPTAPGIRDIWTAMDLPPRRPRLARPPRRKQPAAQHPVLQNRAPGPRRPSPSPPWPPTAPTSSEVTATRDTGYGTLTAARHAADMDGVDLMFTGGEMGRLRIHKAGRNIHGREHHRLQAPQNHVQRPPSLAPTRLGGIDHPRLESCHEEE